MLESQDSTLEEGRGLLQDPEVRYFKNLGLLLRAAAGAGSRLLF